MRYTRMEIPKVSNSSSYRLILEFFIIIPIIATIFGALLTKMLIIPLFNSSISSGNSAGNLITKPVIIGKEYNVFALQAGVYLNKNNAENLVKGMNSQGANAFYVQDGDSFRIIMDVSEDKKVLQEKQTNLTSTGYKCIIHDYNIYVKNQEGQDNKLIDSYRYEVAGLLKLEFQYKEALSLNKEFNMEQVKNAITSIETEYNKVKESGIAKEELDAITKCHSEIIKLGNEITVNKDLIEVLPRITTQIIFIDKLSKINAASTSNS